MASDPKRLLYLGRAENELTLARTLIRISTEEPLRVELRIREVETFFSNAIAAAYYTIFYVAKAYLLANGVTTTAPREHEKTYERFLKSIIPTIGGKQ